MKIPISAMLSSNLLFFGCNSGFVDESVLEVRSFDKWIFLIDVHDLGTILNVGHAPASRRSVGHSFLQTAASSSSHIIQDGLSTSIVFPRSSLFPALGNVDASWTHCR